MKPAEDSSAKAIWSITWRSVLLIPLMLPIAIVWLLMVMSIAVLPLFAILCLWFGLWKDAAIFFAVWAALFWAYRRFALGRIWESPPSFL